MVIFAHYILTFLKAKNAMTHGLQKEVLRKAYFLDWEEVHFARGGFNQSPGSRCGCR